MVYIVKFHEPGFELRRVPQHYPATEETVSYWTTGDGGRLATDESGLIVVPVFRQICGSESMKRIFHWPCPVLWPTNRFGIFVWTLWTKSWILCPRAAMWSQSRNQVSWCFMTSETIFCARIRVVNMLLLRRVMKNYLVARQNHRSIGWLGPVAEMTRDDLKTILKQSEEPITCNISSISGACFWIDYPSNSI